ncbi:helix-turn-helix domain-containing protein [Prevotella intermedia]|nr:helix-turn-helix transcriptional regulator [Prevotella intermedia]
MSKRQRKVSPTLQKIMAESNELQIAKIRNRMILASKIATALCNNNLTQKKFASMMKRSEAEISEWLSGNRNFTIDTLTEISNILGISLLNIELINVCRISKMDITVYPSTQNTQVVSDSKWMVPPLKGKESSRISILKAL